jgi:2-hydroxy-3-keto-5-methylthiopentenyl-1-phosphate phosphatase
MTHARQQQPIVFLDFDGTVARRDVVDAILEAYAGREWLDIEDRWRSGLIGSRECLQAQMALVRASRRQVNALLDEIELDPGLLTLLKTCRLHGLAVHIVSDGFDYCARRLLNTADVQVRALLEGAELCASHLEPDGPEEPDGKMRWRIDFPFYPKTCAHGCATCKPAVMRALNPSAALAIFVGDGLSDRYAITAADVVFAKDSLAAYCVENNVAHRSFLDLADVAMRIDRAFRPNAGAAAGQLWVQG